MKNLPLRDKIFWKNFLSFIVIFLFITFLFAYIRDDDGKSIGFVASYTFTSIFCVLYLGVKIGQKFSKFEDITEKRNKFLKKEEISIQEFRKKYWDIISIYDSSEKWLTQDISQENNTYEFINNAGDKEVYTIGYKNSGKFNIYWDDIIASKNNKKDIITTDGASLDMPEFDPSEATDFVNVKCPICGASIDRFFYIDNFGGKKEEEYGDVGWMEVCFKCKKLIYLDTSIID